MSGKRWRAPRPVHDIAKDQLAWVAGLVEGEGSFYAKGGPYPAARFQLDMADEDVVSHACAIMKVGQVDVQDKGKRSIKPQYRWRVSAQAEVAWVMDMLYPFLGQRRKGKIAEIQQLLPDWIS